MTQIKNYFNTSYVTVQQGMSEQCGRVRRISIHLMLRFNSWASVWFCPWKKFQYILCYGSTLQGCTALKRVTGFQYILCYGSTYCDNKTWIHSRISIHLMLRFNYINTTCSFNFIFISIHLMLRFNNSKYLRIIPKYKISIHLMLRFNTDISPVFCNFFKFQYILCYGSTPCLNQYKILIAIFQYILCYGSTLDVLENNAIEEGFQYILCYGSTYI